MLISCSVHVYLYFQFYHKRITNSSLFLFQDRHANMMAFASTRPEVLHVTAHRVLPDRGAKQMSTSVNRIHVRTRDPVQMTREHFDAFVCLVSNISDKLLNTLFNHFKLTDHNFAQQQTVMLASLIISGMSIVFTKIFV